MINSLRKIFFLISPVFKYKVQGNSMEPAVKQVSEVLVNRLSYLFKNPKVGDIIVASEPVSKKYIIKRVAKISGHKFFLLGDNTKHSIDSRKYGWIIKENILGKVFFKI